MSKQEFISSAVSHYLNGYNCIIFVDRHYHPFVFGLNRYTDFAKLNELYNMFKNDIKENRFKFDLVIYVEE